MFRVEVSVKSTLPDPRGEALKADIRDLGIAGVSQARVSNIYMLEGGLSGEELDTICRELLADPVVEEYLVGDVSLIAPSDAHAVEVAYIPESWTRWRRALRRASATSVSPRSSR